MEWCQKLLLSGGLETVVEFDVSFQVGNDMDIVKTVETVLLKLY